MSATSAAINWLPRELLLSVFSSLEAPLDLYNASLACQGWRQLAVESKLWETHYWRFYRASCQQDDIMRSNDDRRQEAMRIWLRKFSIDERSNADSFIGKSNRLGSPHPPQAALPSSFALPCFLRDTKGRNSAEIDASDFHALFVKRMNKDERLLADLEGYILLEKDTLVKALDLVQAYGDDVRDLLAALPSDQRISAQTVGIFANREWLESGGKEYGNASAREKPEESLRALDVHQRAASGASQPSPESCLSFQHAARHLLGHLQRREAVRSWRRLKEDWKDHSRHGLQRDLRETIARSCIGVEEAVIGLALFRSGDSGELRQYLDLLTLYVWLSIKTDERSLMERGLAPPSHTAITKYGISISTRALVVAIQGVLRALGFGVARPEHAYDISSHFLHMSLWLPGQRQASPITVAAITCAVARRLGVVATLAGTPAHQLIVVMEDGPRPADWRDSSGEQQWERFFVAPGSNDGVGNETVMELGSAKQWLRERGAPLPEFEELVLETRLDPVSPLDILEWVAARLQGAVRDRRQASLGPPQADPPSYAASEPPVFAGAQDDLAALRAYLCGLQASPPSPLIGAIQLSTLAFCPPTQAEAPRADPAAARKDADYAAAWALRVVHPSSRDDPDMLMMCQWLSVAGAYACDIAIFLELYGADVRAEIEAARSSDADDVEIAGRKEARERGLLFPLPLLHVRCFAAKLMGSDRTLSQGLGGTGAGQRGLRMGRDPEELQLLDPAHPRNANVEHSVGTVFKHRERGFLGAVIGWDCVRRRDIGWDSARLTDPDEDDNQPFYHVVVAHDECHRYVAQSNIEVARVPAGSTSEEAVGVLRELVPLLSLRTVGQCFRTVDVSPWGVRAKEGPKEGVERKKARLESSEEGGQVKLLMSAWMRQAWPYD